MFAKPFVGDLSGHSDGVYCMAKHPKKLTTIISGSGDGGTLKIVQSFHFFFKFNEQNF